MFTFILVYIDAGHTPKGDPRRGWLVYDPAKQGEPVRFIPEGYEGDHALHVLAREAFNDPNAPAHTCNGWLKREVFIASRIRVTRSTFMSAMPLVKGAK